MDDEPVPNQPTNTGITATAPILWKRVAVFASSTFSDMHAERDYLVKRVFPDLHDWCERRRLRLVDVDRVDKVRAWLVMLTEEEYHEIRNPPYL